MLKGSNRILSFKISDVWTPVGCLTSNSFNETVEMLSTTTRDNQGWETSVPTVQGYSIPFTGVVPTDGTGKVILTNLRAYKRARTLLDWKIEDVTSGIIDIGKGYLTSVGETADVQGFLTFDAELAGYGVPTQYIDTTPPSAPFLTLDSQTSEAITISWTASTDDVAIKQYNIYRDDIIYDTVTGITLTYEDTNLVDGDVYSYIVSATDTSDNEGALSNKVISSIVSKPGITSFQFQNGDVFTFMDGTVFDFEN